MKLLLYAAAIVALGSAPPEMMSQVASVTAPENAFSSSALPEGLPDAPSTISMRGKGRSGIKIQYQTNIRRFSHWAIAVNAGLGGLGVEVATPLSNQWNLRGGAAYLGGSYHFGATSTSAAANFGTTVQASAIDVDFKPQFRSLFASADWYPWYGSFHVSPGITLYNRNRATVLAIVEGGQELDVGDGRYLSDPADPILATITTNLGRTVAPRLTVGWGNMIPRRGEHFSFPFEIGVEYSGRPGLQLSLSGSECDLNGSACYPITVDPTTQTNINKEQNDLNNDIAPLRFYPILTSGISYRF